jgi:Mitochondrial carrier protein
MLVSSNESNEIPDDANDKFGSQFNPTRILDDKSDSNAREVYRINPSLVLGCSALLVLASLPLIDPAVAIDHPVDFSHLNVPNPLPDADFRYFVSGGVCVCAAASHGITTPIDVVKTRIQSEPEVFNQGVLNAATAIVKEDGPRILLTGLLPTVLGYGLEGGTIY